MIGNNSYIGEGCAIEKSLVLGNDYYTNEKTRAASIEKGESALGIGTCLHPQSTICIPPDILVYTHPSGYIEEASMSHFCVDNAKFLVQGFLAVRPGIRRDVASRKSCS